MQLQYVSTWWGPMPSQEFDVTLPEKALIINCFGDSEYFKIAYLMDKEAIHVPSEPRKFLVFNEYGPHTVLDNAVYVGSCQRPMYQPMESIQLSLGGTTKNLIISPDGTKFFPDMDTFQVFEILDIEDEDDNVS